MIRYFSRWATVSRGVRKSLPTGKNACATLLLGTLLWTPATFAANVSSAQSDLLERTGQRVKQFWDELSSVTCTETLVQEKLNQKGKVTLNAKSTYDYLISMRWDGGGMLVDESRLPSGQPQKKAPQS